MYLKTAPPLLGSTGVPAHKKTPPPRIPTVVLCLGSQGGARVLGAFSWARYP